MQQAIATKRRDAKRQYDRHVNTPLALLPLSVADFTYTKPPHRKSGPWNYGVIIEIPSTRSYVVDTPTGITCRSRGHMRPAAPPPQGALIPRSWARYMLGNSSSCGMSGVNATPSKHMSRDRGQGTHHVHPSSHTGTTDPTPTNQPIRTHSATSSPAGFGDVSGNKL